MVTVELKKPPHEVLTPPAGPPSAPPPAVPLEAHAAEFSVRVPRRFALAVIISGCASVLVFAITTTWAVNTFVVTTTTTAKTVNVRLDTLATQLGALTSRIDQRDREYDQQRWPAVDRLGLVAGENRLRVEAQEGRLRRVELVTGEHGVTIDQHSKAIDAMQRRLSDRIH